MMMIINGIINDDGKHLKNAYSTITTATFIIMVSWWWFKSFYFKILFFPPVYFNFIQNTLLNSAIK